MRIIPIRVENGILQLKSLSFSFLQTDEINILEQDLLAIHAKEVADYREKAGTPTEEKIECEAKSNLN